MTVTSIRQGQPPPARRGRRPVRQIAELAQLASSADKIRYACERLPGDAVTTAEVRAWLLAREVETDPTYAGRVVKRWRDERGEPATPPAGIPIVSDPAPVAAPVPAPVESEPLEADPVPVPVAPPVATPVSAPVAAPPAALEPPVAEPPVVAVVVEEPVLSPVLQPAAATPSPELIRRSKRLRKASYPVLTLVAIAGAALSYQSLETAAEKVFPADLAHLFPLLVDALIVGASLAYLAGATVGRGRAGWRLTAHGAVAGTLLLNGLAAANGAAVPWHIAAPMVWSVIVEMVARDLLGDHRQTVPQPDSLPLVLWLTAPRETASTWLRVRRQAAHAAARMDVGRHAAAVEALRMTLPGWSGRRARRIIIRQLRAGSITPAAVVAIMDDPRATPRSVLRSLLTAATTSNGAAPTL